MQPLGFLGGFFPAKVESRQDPDAGIDVLLTVPWFGTCRTAEFTLGPGCSPSCCGEQRAQGHGVASAEDGILGAAGNCGSH